MGFAVQGEYGFSAVYNSGDFLRVTIGSLHGVIEKCLERSRTRRYQTAMELAADIRRLRAAGRHIGIQLDWYTCGLFLTCPGTIAEIARQAADAGLEAFVGWIGDFPLNTTPERGGAHPVLACAAAACATSENEPNTEVGEIMRREALRVGLPGPVAEAAGEAWRTLDAAGRCIHLADAYAYWWHGTNAPGAICDRIVRNSPADELDQLWVDRAWDITIPELDSAVSNLHNVADNLAEVTDNTGYLPALRKQIVLAADWGKFCRRLWWAAIVYHRMASWDTCHGPWRDDADELCLNLQKAVELLATVTAALQSEELIAGSQWNLKTRLPVLKEQLDAALAAAQNGAHPSPLPHQDVFPYIPK